LELLSLPHRARLRRQNGVVLFVTLVVLLLVTMATLAVIRSADTSTVISGNFAFKQAATQASDRAITDALNNLQNYVVANGGNIPGPNAYSDVRLAPVDGRGIPTAINWTNVASASETGSPCDGTNYCVRYFVERQCGASPDLADPKDIKAKCAYEVRIPANPTAIPPVAEQIAVFYRVIVRVDGPRNTLGYYETMLSGPATL